jgi:hypothetical protein
MTSRKKEEKVFSEILEEAKEDAKKPDPKGIWFGIIGILLGLIGMFIPVGLAWIRMLLFPFVGLCAVFANKYGSRVTGIICGVMAILMFVPSF